MAVIGELTIEQVCVAVRDRITDSLSGVRGQAMDEMTESIPDTPLIQVYFESVRTPEEQVKQTTFGGVVQQTILTINVDVYSSRRANIGEDMARVTIKADEVIRVLQAERVKPFFKLEGIKSFGWRAERVVFEYGKENYMGVRFVLEFMNF